MTIFVRIAAYRDPELLPTLRDCIDQAKWPHDLRFGLCWQHDGSETLDVFAHDSRFGVADLHHLESEGLGWAREKSAQFYNGEDFTLGLDSHHRFVKHWDARLIEMMAQVPSKKPILTSYPPAYYPNEKTARENVPNYMQFVEYTESVTIKMTPQPLPDFEGLKAPVPSRFFAGGFNFAAGRFIEDIPPDPKLYFAGEEAASTVRAFTHGYDLYHPHEIICWHEYKREEKPHHWDDHRLKQGAKVYWKDRAGDSMQRYWRLFGLEPRIPSEEFGVFDFGTERSLREYEKFAGVNYSIQGVQEYTLEGHPPPNPQRFENEQAWLLSFLVPPRRTFWDRMETAAERALDRFKSALDL